MNWIMIAEFIMAWIESCQEDRKETERRLGDPVLRKAMVRPAVRGAMKQAGLRGKERRREVRRWMDMADELGPHELIPALEKIAAGKYAGGA